MLFRGDGCDDREEVMAMEKRGLGIGDEEEGYERERKSNLSGV